MKRFFTFAIACAAVLSVASCSVMGPVGAVYTKTVTPVAATSNNLGTKVGTSQVTGYVGLVAVGDGGINAAAKSAGITKISHVDVDSFSILGVYTVQTYIVYGE